MPEPVRIDAVIPGVLKEILRMNPHLRAASGNSVDATGDKIIGAGLVSVKGNRERPAFVGDSNA